MLNSVSTVMHTSIGLRVFIIVAPQTAWCRS
jgi:hypothetical protein